MEVLMMFEPKIERWYSLGETADYLGVSKGINL